MHVTNGEIWQAHAALEQLIKEPWPVKTAYWLAKLARHLRTAHADIDAVRTDLIRRYGQDDGQGRISIDRGVDTWESFATDFNALMAESVEMDAPVVTLPTDTPISITPTLLMDLEPFITLADDTRGAA